MAHVIDAVLMLRDQFSGQLRNINQSLNDFQRRSKYIANDMRKVGKSTENIGKNFITHVTAPLAAIGTLATKSAMDFKESIADIDTLLDNHSHLKGYEQQVLNISKSTGMNLKTVSEGMYTAVSSLGDGGKETQAIFKTMANSAKAGRAEVNDSVALISAAMKGYGSINDATAKKISDLAFQTAKLGVTTFPEMAKSMQPLFPLAKNLNFSYEELFGTMATLTGVTGNTSEVSTQMKAVFSNLMRPTKDMTELLKKYGFKNGEAMIKTKGLAGTLAILKKETGGQSDKMAKLFSSTEAITALTALTGANYSDLIRKTKEMKNATGATDKALKKVSDTTKDKFNVAINNLRVSLTELGVVLLPIVTQASDIITKAVNKFDKLSKAQKESIIKFAMLAIAIGPVIFVIGKITTGISKTIIGINKLSSSIKKAGGIMSWLTSPGHLVVIALIAIVTTTALVIKNWDKICKTAKEVKEKLIELKNNALDKVKKGFETAKKKIEKFKETLKKSEPTIKSVAKVLGVIFAPALVSTGIKAVKAGARIAGSLIPKIIELGVNALITGTESLITLIGSIIKLGIEAVKTGAKITTNLIGKLVDLGTQVIITAAKITGDLIIAIVSYAAKGWRAVGAIVAQTSAWIIQKGVVVAHTIKLIAHKAAVIGLTGVTKLLTAAQWALNAAFVATPVGWIVLAIGAIIGVAILLHKAWVKNWGGIQDKTQAVVDYVKGKIDSIKETFNSVKDKCAEFAQAIKETWGSIKEWMKHPIQGTISLIKNGDLSGVKGKNALGTPYWGGGLSVVGEHGPEIVEMPSGSKVHDNKDSMRMVGNGGSVTITFGDVHVRKESDIDAIANAIVKKLQIQRLNMA